MASFCFSKLVETFKKCFSSAERIISKQYWIREPVNTVSYLNWLKLGTFLLPEQSPSSLVVEI